MTASVGGREVAHFSSLIVPDDQSANIQFNIGAWNLRLEVTFESKPAVDGQPPPQPGISIESLGDSGKMVFTNWDNALGTATKDPFEIARSHDGAVVSVMVWHMKTGSTSRLDLQFMVGARP